MKIMVFIKNVTGDAKAMEIALKHAKAFEGTIHLVSAIENQASMPEEIIEGASKRLKKMAGDISESHKINCEQELLLTSLPIGEALVNYADKKDMDEIIMPLKKRSKLGKLFFGSDTQFIILEAPCQVITIKD